MLRHSQIHDNSILSVENVTIKKLYNNEYVPLIQNASFSLKKGEAIVTIQEDEMRNSALAAAIVKLTYDRSYKIDGEIVFNSRVLGKVSLLQTNPTDMQKIRGNEIGFISKESENALNPGLSCGKQVMEAICTHQKVTKKEVKKRAIKLLEQVKITNVERLFYSYPSQLTEEQKKLILIAIGIACNPSVIIAENPTQGLNSMSEKNIISLFRSLKKQCNTSLILFSRNIPFIKKVAEKVVIMHHGKIVEKGNIKQLFLDPQQPYTKAVLSCRIQPNLKPIPDIDDFIKKNKKGEIISHQKSLVSLIGRIIYRYKRKAIRAERVEEKIVQTMKPLISVENLTIYSESRKKMTFFKELNFNIYSNEIVGTIHQLSDSKIEILIKKIRHIASKNRKKNVQVILKSPQVYLNPTKRIIHELSEIMKVNRIGYSDESRKKEVIHLLEMVGLHSGYVDVFPLELSPDESFRIYLAKILIVKPQLIILNKIMNYIVSNSRIINLLLRLKDKYKWTYWFFSYDLNFIKYISDRVILLYQEKIQEISSTKNFFKNPQSEYGKELIKTMY